MTFWGWVSVLVFLGFIVSAIALALWIAWKIWMWYMVSRARLAYKVALRARR